MSAQTELVHVTLMSVTVTYKSVKLVTLKSAAGTTDDVEGMKALTERALKEATSIISDLALLNLGKIAHMFANDFSWRTKQGCVMCLLEGTLQVRAQTADLLVRHRKGDLSSVSGIEPARG